MTSSGDLTRLLMATLEAAHFAGYHRALILIDEFEAPFILDSRKDMTIFSEFLRGLYDSLIDPSEKSPPYPHTQFLFSGTAKVFQEFQPAAITRQIDQGGLMAAFLRRTEQPFFLDPPNQSELKDIARDEIKRTRKRRQEGLIPFDEDALILAWKRSSLNLGQFLRFASDMYLMAEEEGASSVTTNHLEKVLKTYEVADA
jgi:hypothetical protein